LTALRPTTNSNDPIAVVQKRRDYLFFNHHEVAKKEKAYAFLVKQMLNNFGMGGSALRRMSKIELSSKGGGWIIRLQLQRSSTQLINGIICRSLSIGFSYQAVTWIRTRVNHRLQF